MFDRWEPWIVALLALLVYFAWRERRDGKPCGCSEEKPATAAEEPAAAPAVATCEPADGGTYL